MRRVRHFLAFKRHWIWYGLSGATMAAGAVSQVVSSETHPVAFVALSLMSGIGGLVAHACAPQGMGDDA